MLSMLQDSLLSAEMESGDSFQNKLKLVRL